VKKLKWYEVGTGKKTTEYVYPQKYANFKEGDFVILKGKAIFPKLHTGVKQVDYIQPYYEGLYLCFGTVGIIKWEANQIFWRKLGNQRNNKLPRQLKLFRK
jgi:hypothetical protein